MIDAIFLSNSWILKSSIFLGVFMLVYALFRKYASASFWHMIWVVVFSGMLLLPIFSNLSWNYNGRIEIPVQTNIPLINLELKEVQPTPIIPPSNTAISVPLPQPELANTSPKNIDWSFWIKTIWALGIAFCVFRLLLERFFLKLLYRKSKNGSDEMYGVLKQVQGQTQFQKAVKIAVSTHIDIPFTAGWRKPVIYVPKNFESYDFQKQRYVLLHELAHIKRQDGLSSLLTQLVCAVLWFNPLVWLAAKWSKLDMEKACDDLVICATEEKYDYASLMLDIIETSQFKPFYAQSRLAMASENELKSRMYAILDDKINRDKIGKYGIIGATIIALCLLIPLASLQVVQQNEQSEDNIDITPYLTALESEDAMEVKMAAWALGTVEKKETVSSLVAKLNHENPEVRSMIAWALGEIKEKSTLDDLLKLTQDKEPLVREMATMAVGELDQPASINALKNLLNDNAVGVRVAAVWALGEISNSRALDIVQQSINNPSKEVKKMAITVLGERRFDKAISDLAKFITSSDIELKIAAVAALKNMKTEATLPHLTKALKDDHTNVRIHAAQALGVLKNKRAVADLMPLLKDNSIEVREMAVWALDELEF